MPVAASIDSVKGESESSPSTIRAAQLLATLGCQSQTHQATCLTRHKSNMVCLTMLCCRHHKTRHAPALLSFNRRQLCPCRSSLSNLSMSAKFAISLRLGIVGIDLHHPLQITRNDIHLEIHGATPGTR